MMQNYRDYAAYSGKSQHPSPILRRDIPRRNKKRGPRPSGQRPSSMDNWNQPSARRLFLHDSRLFGLAVFLALGNGFPQIIRQATVFARFLAPFGKGLRAERLPQGKAPFPPVLPASQAMGAQMLGRQHLEFLPTLQTDYLIFLDGFFRSHAWKSSHPGSSF